MDSDKPIIIVKKSGGHGGHHGGAWKIAYADFVTAMMAFFLVMWLVNTAADPVKESIASYFRRPGLFQSGSGTPLQIGGSGILDDAYVPSSPEERANESGESQAPKTNGYIQGKMASKDKRFTEETQSTPAPKPTAKENEEEDPDAKYAAEPTPIPELSSGVNLDEASSLDSLASTIKEEIQSSPELQELLGVVDVNIDSDGLNIEIMDTDKTSMFASGSSYIKEEARTAFSTLANALKRVKNQIEIVGHTDAHPFSNRANGYSNWELSTDRANAARRLLIGDGIDPSRMMGVLGKADTMPKNVADPFAASNRRITLKLKFDMKKPEPQPTPKMETIDMKHDVDAAKKLQESSEEMDDYTPSGPAPLERIHSFTTKDIVQKRSDVAAKAAIPMDAPPPSRRGPVEWKEPKFFGE